MSSDSSASSLQPENFEPIKAPWLFEDDDNVQRAQFAQPEKKKKKPKFFAFLSLLLVIGVVAGAVYLGMRIDYQKIDPEPPTAAEKERQDMAVETARILSYSKQNGQSEIATHAEKWLEMLGGVWQPWPDGNLPEGRTNPPYETEPPAQADTSYLIEQLNDLSNSATDQASLRAGEEREALIRIAIDAKICAARVAVEAGQDAPVSGTLDIENLAGVANSDTLTTLSQARQWLEKDASLVDVTGRATLSARIETISALEEAILAHGVADKRPAVSPLPQLKDEQTLTSVALSHIANTLIKSSLNASAEQIRAVVAYVYSLYLDDTERAEADILNL